MNLRKIRTNAINFINKFRFYANAKQVEKYAKEQIKKGNCYIGSDEEYNKKIIPFWSKYGVKPKKFWFQYYGQKLGEFNPYVIPGDMFQKELLPFLNNHSVQDTLENKLYFDMILYDIKKPINYVKYVNGIYLDNDNHLISREQAIEAIRGVDRVIAKPIDDSRGNSVKIVNVKDDFDKAWEYIDKNYGHREYILQEVVKQSPQLEKYNPTSINTLRIISLIVNGKVEILSSIVRVGAEGAEIDNYSKGGDARPIHNPEGTLKGFMIYPKGFSETDTKGNPIGFDKIIGYEKVIEEIKKYHPRFPHLRWIGWDFAIDENYEPVLIELNGAAGDNQKSDGPMFKEFTEIILDEYFASKNK